MYEKIHTSLLLFLVSIYEYYFVKDLVDYFSLAGILWQNLLKGITIKDS